MADSTYSTLQPNSSEKMLESWKHIRYFTEYSLWSLNGLSVAVFVLVALCVLIPSFKIRKRLMGVRLLVFIVVINRPSSKFALPVPLLAKVREQQLAESMKKSASEIKQSKRTGGPQPFPKTTVKAFKIGSHTNKRAKMPLAKMTTTPVDKTLKSPTT